MKKTKRMFFMCVTMLLTVGAVNVVMATTVEFVGIQAGDPVKFDSSGIEKYSQVGWLFNKLKDASFSDQAEFNLAILEIMTPDPLNKSREYLFKIEEVAKPAPPEVPIPAAAWLFASGILGIIGIARRI